VHLVGVLMYNGDMDASYLFSSTVRPLKSGLVSTDDEGSTVIFAVYDREAAEAEVGFPATDPDFATNLTGLYYSYSGPGRSFCNDPIAKVYGKKVLITQRRGLDI
jgi:hypothetical protein